VDVLESGLSWGLILYGEEEETLLAESKDPVLSAIWKVGSVSGGKKHSAGICACDIHVAVYEHMYNANSLPTPLRSTLRHRPNTQTPTVVINSLFVLLVTQFDLL
jgi:hypothetical protein